jgi:hypothetical protein
MPSATYQLFRNAILNEKQVTCFYNSHKKEQACIDEVDLDINIHVRKLR